MSFLYTICLKHIPAKIPVRIYFRHILYCFFNNCNYGTNHTYNTVNFPGFRIFFLLCQVINFCSDNQKSYDKSNYFNSHYFFFHFNKNAEFVITSTEPALCTSAPTIGFRIPVIANTMAMKFNVMEKVIFNLIVVIIRLERAIR